MIRPNLVVGVVILMGLAVTAQLGAEPAVRAFVSIPPQAYFVERVGGDRVAVEVMVGPGRSPTDYAPTPKQMAALSRADVYFSIGVPFEAVWLSRIRDANPAVRVVDTRRGTKLRRIDEGEHGDAGHEGHHGHEAGALDPHIWLSPRLAKLQARTVLLTLCDVDPAGRAAYEAGFASFVRDVDELDNRILFSMQNLPSRTLMVFHPAFGYFADAYQLEQVAVETGGKEPSARQITRLVEMARERSVRVIFVQPQFSKAGAAAIAESIDGVVVPIDPLARDWLANLSRMADEVVKGLQ